jgi:maltooligosyltrehalose trehalohydrolase
MPALSHLDKDCCDVWSDEKEIIFMRRWTDNNHILALFNFNKTDVTFNSGKQEMEWKKVLDSSCRTWYGQGTLLPEIMTQHEELMIRAESFALYMKNR